MQPLPVLRIFQRIPRATAFLLCLPVVLTMLLACTPKASVSKSTPDLAAEITVIGWEGYMPESVLEAFEAETGVAIRYIAYGDPIEVTEALRRGESYDIVVLDNVELQLASQENLLAELDHRNLPNFSHIAGDFRDLTFDPQNRYSVPFQWGTSGLLYRTDLVEEELTHWADLWKPAYANKIAVWPFSSDLIGMTLKSLGYSYNSEDPEELAQAGERLMELKGRVTMLDLQLSSGVHLLKDSEIHVVFGWAYDMQVAEAEGLEHVQYVVPAEGTIIWMDNLAIPASSPNQRTAELFLDFIMRPQIAAQIANELYVAIPNEGAKEFIKPDLLNNPLIFPTMEEFVNAEFYALLSPDGQRMRDEIWLRFLAPVE